MASLNWLALPQVLILRLSTLPPIHLCPPTCMIRSGSMTFCNGRLMIVACPGRKVNWHGLTLHVGMYFYPTSPKYPIDHFRCLAACSVSADPTLPARFCCWTCRQPGEGCSVKSLWPSFTAFSWHWKLNPRQAASQGLDFAGFTWRCHDGGSCSVVARS